MCRKGCNLWVISALESFCLCANIVILSGSVKGVYFVLSTILYFFCGLYCLSNFFLWCVFCFLSWLLVKF